MKMDKDSTNRLDVTAFSEKKVKINDIYMNYAEAGRGDPIVLIHGWTNNWIGFVPVAKELLEKYRVILVDLPGYGGSDRLEKYSMEIEAGYVKLFLEKLDIENCTLVGHSMGGYVVAKCYQNFPNSMARIVLVGGVFKKNNKERTLKISHKLYSLAKRHEKIRDLMNRIIKRKSYSYFTAKLINMYKFDKNIIDLYGAIEYKNVCKRVYVELGEEAMRDETRIEEMIKNNSVPMLLIFGKYDKIANLAQARACLEGKGDYQYAEIDESGHIVTVEKPKEVAQAIETFIVGNKIS
ncbi:MAG: alpha/beta hydrolase [Candidatus Shapirobacteria bacterium]|jgi:pimeloyl-ACP methyl ester carboxylesterase